MSAIHLHLLLGYAALRRDDGLARVSLAMFAILAVVPLVTFLTGAREEAVEGLAGVSEAAIEQHEEAALLSTIALGVVGGISLAALLWFRPAARRASPPSSCSWRWRRPGRWRGPPTWAPATRRSRTGRSRRRLDIGLLLRCNVVVYAADQEGTSVVSAMDPEAALEFAGSEQMAGVAREVRERLARVLAIVSASASYTGPQRDDRDRTDLLRGCATRWRRTAPAPERAGGYARREPRPVFAQRQRFVCFLVRRGCGGYRRPSLRNFWRFRHAALRARLFRI